MANLHNVDAEVLEFFNEIYHMHKTGTEVTVIECDSIIQRIYDYNGKLEDISVKGRGGTSFDPVFDYLFEHRNEFNNLIYLFSFVLFFLINIFVFRFVHLFKNIFEKTKVIKNENFIIHNS